ncbi:hypothetical protein M0804_015619 [Polistes exclamans]|nr:hypothetical protein M0804_015619 [Polistes exclamans]
MGEIYMGRGGRYEVTVVAPTALCQAAIEKGHVVIGCGEPGHVARDCGDKLRCPICVEAGRSRISHRAGSWECPLVPPARGKGRVNTLGGVAGQRDKLGGSDMNASGSAGKELNSVLGNVDNSVGEGMEIKQTGSAPPCDLLGQRMREIGAGIAIVSEPWWVLPGDENWFTSLGGLPLSAIIAGKGERTCSLVRRGLFFVAVKWEDSLVVSVYSPPSENLNSFSRLLDELEELLGTFPAIPALVAGDFNARFPTWDPEGRSNPRGELLCMWANRLNLSLADQVGHPTCVRPQGSSVVDLTWGSLAASVRLTDWKVDEAESLSDHLYVIFKYMHEATGFRSSCPRNKIFSKWDTRVVDEDRLGAALVSGEWTRDDEVDLVTWVNDTLLISRDMSMPRIQGGLSCSEA